MIQYCEERVPLLSTEFWKEGTLCTYHSEISVEGVEYALRRLKLTKASGKTALRLNISNLVLWLKQIFNAIVEMEEISKFHHYSYH